MADFNLPTYNLNGSIAEAKNAAEQVKADALVIVAGGLKVAREYARASYEAQPTRQWLYAIEHQPKLATEMVESLAEGAFQCAHAIDRRGAAWFYENEMLAVATLIPDASAGPVGFFPLFNVR